MKKKALMMAMGLALVMGTGGVHAFGGETASVVYQSDREVIDNGPMDAESTQTDEHQYTLEILDDENAVLTEKTFYGVGQITSNEYPGIYTRDDEKSITFHFVTDYDEVVHRIALEGDKIVNVETTYGNNAMIKDLAGVYTGYDDVHGAMELDLAPNGTVQVTCENGNQFYGSMYDYGGSWDFTGYELETYEDVDWIIQLEGDKFTYQTYFSTIFSEYAGSYDLDGDLGAFTITSNEDGRVAFDVEINGQMVHMEGTLYVDTELKEVTGLYVSSDDGYLMNLNLKWMPDDNNWNYSGSYTVPLGAG